MAKLIRLAYASRACFEPSVGSSELEPDIIEILAQSRVNNQSAQIGGVLYYADGYFFQCLEGDESMVLNLVEKIRQDDRHRDLKISFCKKIRRRYFKAWSMKYVPIGNAVTDLIKSRGYSSFTPSEFDESDINSLLHLFSQLKDTSLKNEKLKACYRLKLHWWQRLIPARY
ncbi:BLUF domain-containing protein [Arenicella xantha]|uniref:FAD-dependent sensor of blue light n=1 Tax=Arenicella xantha TaxID=644221 RepID=A0A395JR25_9GAMM|nr:BLUF domain-containing protein [Arenicella xantha]RBP51170.1 FAD-dependent sensor of blue light [Arenicella xantha]